MSLLRHRINVDCIKFVTDGCDLIVAGQYMILILSVAKNITNLCNELCY